VNSKPANSYEVHGDADTLVKQMFQFAVERGIMDSNPCADIRRQSVGGTERSRERNLNHDEIRALWLGLETLSQLPVVQTKPAPGRRLKPEERKPVWISRPMALALKILLATGQRRGELVKARWLDIDVEGATWIIPAAHSKNGRAHRVPLSPVALDLFHKLKALAGTSTLVLPSYPGRKATPGAQQPTEAHHTPITERALTKAAERLQGQVWVAQKGKSTPLPHWTPHDLRRTVATQLSELGALPHLVEKVLNHTMQGVMAVYNRHDYMDECRQALNLWAGRPREIEGEQEPTVPEPRAD
jgi:integrase